MENHTQLATRTSRVFAFLIDHVIISFIIVIPFVFYMMNQDNSESGIVLTVFWIAMFFAFIFYSLKDVVKGVSIGKWIFGLGVRDEDNLKTIPPLTKLILRNLTIVIWPIEFVVLAARSNKQRLGDRLAKTAVVKVREVSAIKKIIAVLLTIILLAVIMFVSIAFMFKGTDSYQTAENYIEDSSQIIRETGGIEGFGFLPAGSIQITNGYGEAYFTIKVKGEEKDIYVDIYLTKKPRNEWDVQEIHYSD
ncbi:RDD family protein [Alkalihalobacillus sp. AL-G]|uniref:RDD family protein n=1 Tax=Alkalihalobacillus sp. AL-G TaxID=2926399 RepID=UPI002729CD20|nr:RDD family protein [Alkalihalobacillus sp. AL-G]WLD92576.1 RDD family protein [Alkalihalobacillus sp. AL-G]